MKHQWLDPSSQNKVIKSKYFDDICFTTRHGIYNTSFKISSDKNVVVLFNWKKYSIYILLTRIKGNISSRWNKRRFGKMLEPCVVAPEENHLNEGFFFQGI